MYNNAVEDLLGSGLHFVEILKFHKKHLLSESFDYHTTGWQKRKGGQRDRTFYRSVFYTVQILPTVTEYGNDHGSLTENLIQNTCPGAHDNIIHDP